MDRRNKQIQDLFNINLQLMEHILFLEGRVLELEKELAKYLVPKYSSNHSIPPSKDENLPKKMQSLMENSGKKSGGQTGHKGHILEMSSVPDAVTDHIPGFCSCCGYDLSAITAEYSLRRQVIDLPLISPGCTEHRSYHNTCRCGTKNKAAYLDHATAPVQYGSAAKTLVGYLHDRKYLPYPSKRIAQSLLPH